MYDELDKRILNEVAAGRNPLNEHSCWAEAERIAAGTGREGFRIIDGRLKALRKAGALEYRTKAQGGGVRGWRIPSNTPAPAVAAPGPASVPTARPALSVTVEPKSIRFSENAGHFPQKIHRAAQRLAGLLEEMERTAASSPAPAATTGRPLE